MPRTKTTDAQRAAARANGAKSKGPASPSGKARSASNSTKHGLSSSTRRSALGAGLLETLVLRSESDAAFATLLDAYRAEYQPQGQTEADLVEEAVAAKWLQRRCWALQTAILDLAMQRMHEEDQHGLLAGVDDARRTALAFVDECGRSNALALIARYLARHTRDFHRAFDKLRVIQAERRAAASDPKTQNGETNPSLSQIPSTQAPATIPPAPPNHPTPTPTPHPHPTPTPNTPPPAPNPVQP